MFQGSVFVCSCLFCRRSIGFGSGFLSLCIVGGFLSCRSCTGFRLAGVFHCFRSIGRRSRFCFFCSLFLCKCLRSLLCLCSSFGYSGVNLVCYVAGSVFGQISGSTSGLLCSAGSGVSGFFDSLYIFVAANLVDCFVDLAGYGFVFAAVFDSGNGVADFIENSVAQLDSLILSSL